MRAHVATLLSLLLVGCFSSRECVETCEQVVADACTAPGMAACDVLCAEIDAEAETAGCSVAWGDLEYCMGLDPVCAGDSRCGAERGAYNECVRSYCVENPAVCTP